MNQASQVIQPSQGILTQSSQGVPTQSRLANQPNQQRQFAMPRRVPSQRILQKNLSKKVDGEGSSKDKAMKLD